MHVPRSLAASIAVLACAAQAHADPPVVVGLDVRGGGERAELVVRGAFGVPRYAVRTRDGGSVVVLDVADARLPADGVHVRGSSALVTRTTASTTSRGVRIEIALARAAAYRARADAGRIVLSLEQIAAGAGGARSGGAASGASGGSNASRGSNAGRGSNASADAAASGPLAVERVQVERRDGRDRVIVELSRPAGFRVVPGTTGPARLEIEGAALGAGLPRAISGIRGVTRWSARCERARARGAR